MTLPQSTITALATLLALILIVSINWTSEHLQESSAERGNGALPDTRTFLPRSSNLIPTQANQSQPIFPVHGMALMQRDSPTSVHPVERAVSNGIVLDQSMEATHDKNQWMRLRLVESEVQPRLLRVVELWNFDWLNLRAICLKREMFLADEVIIKSEHGISEINLRQRLLSEGMEITGSIAEGVFTVRLPKADLQAVPAALHFFLNIRNLLYPLSQMAWASAEDFQTTQDFQSNGASIIRANLVAR